MPENQPASLGAVLQEARTEAMLSKRQLAERVGVHFTYIGKLEAGKKHPSADMLQRIAAALNLDTDEVLTLTGLQASSALPSPRMYFRRKFGVSEDEAEVLAQLVKHQLERNQGGP